MNIGLIKNKEPDKGLFVDTNLVDIDKEYLVNNYVKLAILAVLAGYKKNDYIYVDGNFGKTDLKKLSSFISYTLNHNIAPRKYKIKISQSKENILNIKKIKPNNLDSILCFSGGIDSTAGLLYALSRKQKILPLWVDFGQRNNMAEYQAVKKILLKLKIKPLSIKIDLNKFILAGWKDWDFIIPGRNFLFLSLANSYLQYSQKRKGTIYLCSHKDEMGYWKNKDKSQYFFDKTSNFFSNNRKEMHNLTPFSSYSKSEIISFWKRHWEKKFKISPHDTTTCYYENGCGKCGACLKRAIYLIAGGYKIDSKFKVNPMRDTGGLIMNRWLPNIKKNKISRSNKLDFLIAIESSINVVPNKVRDFYYQLPKQTFNAMSRRKDEIESVIIR